MLRRLRGALAVSLAATALLTSPAQAQPPAGPTPTPSGSQPSATMRADTAPTALDWSGTLVGAPPDGRPMPRFRVVTSSAAVTSDTDRKNRDRIVTLVTAANDAAGKYDAAVAEVSKRTRQMVSLRADLTVARLDVARAQQEAKDFAAAVAKGHYNGQVNKMLESMYAGDPSEAAHNIALARTADAWKGDAITHRDAARLGEARATANVKQAVEARQRAVDVLGDALVRVRTALADATAFLNATPGVGGLAAVFPDPTPASTVTVGQVGPLSGLRPLTAVVIDPSPEAAARIQATNPATVSTKLSSVTVNGTRMMVAGIDPTLARTLAPADAANMDALWRAVARGELVVAHASAVAANLKLAATVKAQPVFYGPKVTGDVPVTVGGYATLNWPGVDAVTSAGTVDRLGTNHTMLLVSTVGDPAEALIGIRRDASGADVVPVASMSPAASGFLPPGEAKQAIGGGFAWTTGPENTAVIDPAWEQANIVGVPYPVVGALRCNRLLSAQLTGALNELAARGLTNLFVPAATSCYTAARNGRLVTSSAWGLSVHLQPVADPQAIASVIEPEVSVVMRRWGFRQSTETPDYGTFTLAALLRQS